MIPISRQLEKKAIKKFVSHGRFWMDNTIAANNAGMNKTTKNEKLRT